MSLAVAIWQGGRFELATDGRSIQHSGSMARAVVKGWRIGGWIAAWAGDVAVGQAFVKASQHVAPADPEDVAEILTGAFRAVLDMHGSKRDDGTRFIAIDVLAVGRGGILVLRGCGSLLSPDDGFAAIGCADEYAVGLMDGWGRPFAPADASVIIGRAARRYPGVGQPILQFDQLGTA